MIYPSTWDFLLNVTRETNQRIPLHIFCWLLHHEDSRPILKDVTKGTGLNARSIKAGVETLYQWNLIIKEKGKGNKTHLIIDNGHLPEIVVANDILYSLFNIRYEEKKADIRDDNFNLFTLADVRADDDWKKAEPILAKYFQPFQYDPSHLVTKKQYFGPLVELLTEPAVDFDAYCKWFRVEKYPTKKFVYGLFLHAGVIAEYRNSIEEDETSRYSNTSKMNQSDSFKESLKKTEEFIASLEDDDEG